MILEGLCRRLERKGIDPGAYDLEGSQKDEVYCLEHQQQGWVYYYRERGIRRDERVFEAEEDACSFFLARVLKDPTTRVGG